MTKTVFMVWASVFKSWNSSLIFVEKRVKINTDLKINNILVLAFEEIKNISKISISLSKEIEYRPTLQYKLTIGANVIFQDFIVRRRGFLHRQIWIQIIFGCSMLKAKVTCVARTSVDVLMTSRLRELAKISQETLRAWVGNFRKRIKLLIEKKGRHKENK